MLLRNLVRLIYRVTILGHDHVPPSGPVLFVSNHVSYADPVLISFSTPQPVRFLMWRPIYKWKPLAWFFRLMRAIPISSKDSPRLMMKSLVEARRALKNGERIGLFAEGEISRSGQLQEFQKGVEHVADGAHAPIVPVYIDGMWGSIFSFEGGRFFWKVPRSIPYPVTVIFGVPLPAGTSSEDVQRAVSALRIMK